jgi:hypothetical protein
MALKEWASVVHAFARGEQLVLIRKGGLAEATQGFEIVSKQFVFYPTFEHQTVNFIRQPYRQYLDHALAQRPAEDQLRLELGGLVVSSTSVHDPALISRLEPVHIYNDTFLEQRLRWQPTQPLVVAVVRAFRLPAPQILPVVSRYAGCKSWVDLEQPLELAGAVPILDDQAFADRLARIQAVLAGP